MIIVCGISHSYTSAVMKFLKDNGGYIGKTTGMGGNLLSYRGYENVDLIEWVARKKILLNLQDT